MCRSVGRFLLMTALTLGLLLLVEFPAHAQDQCAPFSGNIYFWLTDTWHGVADFTIGSHIYHASVVTENTSFTDDGDTWLGSEQWTLDFGKGNTILVNTQFVSQHMNDAVSPAGVFDLTEVGTFVGGKGKFRHAYGNLLANGPFGPNVKLPDNIQPPPDAQWFGVVPSAGMICGMEHRR